MNNKSVLTKALTLVRGNVLPVVMGAALLIQMPFSVLYFMRMTERSSKTSVPIATPDTPQASIEETGEAAQLPFPGRDDPFQLLPGMEARPDQAVDGQTGVEATIMEAFQGQSSAPVTSGTQLDSAGAVGAPSIEVKPLMLPAMPADSGPIQVKRREDNPRGGLSLRLNGIARCRGKAMAVFQLDGKSTVQTAEGERVPGTDYKVKSVQDEMVVLARNFNGKPDIVTLAVGEESRK